MKRPSLGGLTAMGVLVLAIGAGAVGGALAAGGQQAPAAPVQVESVAEEVTPSPMPTVTVTATPEPEPDPAPVEEPEVSDPAPIVETMPRPETATEAADRAKAEADRAKQEADRAAEVVSKPAPAPEPTDAAVPKPPMTEEEAAAKAEVVKQHHEVMGEQLPGVNGAAP